MKEFILNKYIDFMKRCVGFFNENTLTIGVGASLITMILWGYFLFYPFKIVELKRFYVTNTVVKKGEFVNYILNFEKYRDTKPEITYYLVDGIRYELVGSGARQPEGEAVLTGSKFIPTTEAIPAGRYKLQIDLSYKINSLREPIEYSWFSNTFEIIE